MKRLALVLLMLVAVPVSAAPFRRMPAEPIPNAGTPPTCLASDNAARYVDDATGVVWTCVDGVLTEAAAPTAGIPAGVIVMWSGTLASIPSGWALCDGVGGRPDLRGMFVKGTAAGVDPGATGGAATHGHAYSDNLQHSHAVNVTDPGHAHVENQNSATTGGLTGWAARDTSTNTSAATGYSTASATTGVTATTSNPAGSVATGNTQTTNHEPPFVTVAFICKT